KGKSGRGTNRLVLLGARIELSTPSLIIFVIGCGLFISPFMLGRRIGGEDPGEPGNPVTTGGVSSSTLKTNALSSIARRTRVTSCAFLEDANLLIVSGTAPLNLVPSMSQQYVVLTSLDRGKSFTVSKNMNIALSGYGVLRLCGSSDGRYIFAASTKPEGRVFVSGDKGESWHVSRVPREEGVVSIG